MRLLPGKSVTRRRQSGIALAAVLFLMVVLSMLAGAILYSANAGTISAFNFNAETRAFYAADAGLQAAQNWFDNDYTPASASNYTVNTTPVTYQGQIVILDGKKQTSNYPNNQTFKDFDSHMDHVSIGNGAGMFSIVATLIAVRSVRTITGPSSAERWKVESIGTWTTGSGVGATADLIAYVEPQVTPLMNWAMFSLSKTCGSISLSGGATTDSWNSSMGTYAATKSSTGGDVGSDGNIGATGSVTIGGNALVPYGQVGTCNPGSPGDLTTNGNIKVNGSVLNMVTPINFQNPQPPTPWLPATYPPNLGGLPNPMLPGNYGDISIQAQTQLVLQGGQNGAVNVYNINSLTETGQASIVINPPGGVQVNIVGLNQTSPLMMAGGSVINTGAPGSLVFEYAGTGSVTLTGGSSSSYVYYGPSSNVTLSGNTDYYGAIIASTIKDTGGAKVHYDNALKNTLMQLGPMQVVSWNRTVD